MFSPAAEIEGFPAQLLVQEGRIGAFYRRRSVFRGQWMWIMRSQPNAVLHWEFDFLEIRANDNARLLHVSFCKVKFFQREGKESQ
jgi:hypothetical protein